MGQSLTYAYSVILKLWTLKMQMWSNAFLYLFCYGAGSVQIRFYIGCRFHSVEERVCRLFSTLSCVIQVKQQQVHFLPSTDTLRPLCVDDTPLPPCFRTTPPLADKHCPLCEIPDCQGDSSGYQGLLLTVAYRALWGKLFYNLWINYQLRECYLHRPGVSWALLPLEILSVICRC